MSSHAMYSQLSDWPDAVDVINEAGRSNIVLLCEHASNHMPAEYDSLGLASSDLQRHIAWDVGASLLTQKLSRLLDAPAFLGNYSRLLIDLNRPIGSVGSIPTLSEDTAIPGNVGISKTERSRRENIMFKPFHDRVSKHLDERTERCRPTRIITVHSFAAVYLGVARPWHAGVLFGTAEDLASELIAALRQDAPTLNIEANVPYVVQSDSDYAIPIHGDDRGYEAVLIEIRQDLLTSTDEIDMWAERLTTALRSIGGDEKA